MRIQYSYNLTGKKRKEFVQAISDILGKPAVYQKAPTFAYAIGLYNVDKNGVLSCTENVSPDELERLINQLKEHGYISESSEEISTENVEHESERSPGAENNESNNETVDDNTFIVEIPKTGFSEEALERLTKIIDSKAPLFRKAIGTDHLSVIIDESRLRFPWFTLHGLDGEADAYHRLISALCEMAKKQKLVITKECSMENEKFTMRLFLIRLGFIGDEYKAARKILLRNLSGNGSWRYGYRPERPASTENQNEGGAHYGK